MFIKSIILDGFKSYGQRTEVGPFHHQFNAITGLNGTGKSNILDAICFVLGITNLSQVRAASLQDLIYKNGQAGVRKATVCLVFDNRNTAQSPAGFEDYKEVTVTRQVEMGDKTKYFLNGHPVQNKRIQDLFCSIQLNINNPNFLVMQGKITKVLNMKSTEILSLIEEAAGTTMYQKKRDSCIKSIEKKNKKVLELIAVMNEEVEPQLKKLREERAQYDEFCQLEREGEHLMRLYEAWQFCVAKRNTVISKQEMENGLAKIQEIETKIEQNREQIENIEAEVENAHKNARAEEANKLVELESRLKSVEVLEAKANAAERAAKEALLDEEKRKEQLEKQLKASEKDLSDKEAELNKVKNMYEKLKHDDEADAEAFVASQKKCEALSAGMEINEDGKAETLMEQLMNARSTAAQAQTEHQQATMQLKHCTEQLKKKELEFAASNADTGEYKKKIIDVQRDIKNLENSIKKLNYDGEEQMPKLQQRNQELTRQREPLANRINNFVSRYPYTNFKYTDPTPNFDRSRIYGCICKLIKIKSPEVAFALEIAAGGRLFEVVVENEHVSKLLINKGNLQYRTTFVPLNKIKGNVISPDIVKFAKNLVGAENVQTALTLIDYNTKFQKVMEYVFGNVLICKDINMAKTLAFHPRIKKRCVTLEGDVIDPAGVFEGGSMPKEEPMLNTLVEIMQYEKELKRIDEQLREIEQFDEVHQKWVTLSDQLKVKQHELAVLEKVMKNTWHYKLQEEIQNLKQEIDSLKAKLKETKEIEQKNTIKVQELEKKVKDSKGYMKDQLKLAEKEMKQLQQKAEKSRENWKKHEQNYETLVLEISELQKEIKNIKQQIQNVEENLIQLKETYDSVKSNAVANKAEVAKVHEEVKAEKHAVAEKNRDIQKRIHKKEQLLAQISEYELQIKKLQHEVNKLTENYKMLTAKEKEYTKKCKDEKLLKEAEALSERDGNELEKKVRYSQSRRNALSRVVNANVQAMFEQHEKECNEIQRRIAIVKNDKRKIEEAIVQLDERKKNTVIEAHQQVSRDFGSIFGTLLPGSNAELRPPQGKTVLDGLEIKVSLGGVWKDNISELSGGQRSLAALSLILSILLYKPAPLYILDEVDAALDISHTQNIGTMLKTHFTQSQFIIVSLKDGMFNNANVLFRTQFVDGVSAVSRSTSN